MKANKTTIIVLGCLGVLCLCSMTAGILGVGYYFYAGNANVGSAQATIPPENIPTRLPATTPTASSGSAQSDGMPEALPNAANETTLDDLVRISVLSFGYSDDSDDADEGVTVDIVFYAPNDEVITFDATPVEITLEFYAFTDFWNSSELSNGTLVYSETFVRDHSATLDEMFDHYIRISYATLDVDRTQYDQLGSLRAIVTTPNGSFEDVSMLVRLYSDE